MSPGYRNNHYVPAWYLKRFIPENQVGRELHYLDLKPGFFVDRRGVSHPRRSLSRLGPKYCFRAKDLYTIRGDLNDSTHLEQLFFGEVDTRGLAAVEYFSRFKHPSVEPDALRDLLVFMTVQRLRTPKGLTWLREQSGGNDREVLQLVVRLQQVFGALWTECVWLIADASQTATKFIVSDHPVTVYNRRCGPLSHWCRNGRDPDIRLHGTHTLFPLTLEKVLILTNLSWVRNPYQSELEPRPNPGHWRTAVFNFTSIQTERHLSEDEVRQINFIVKSRALRYVAAGKIDWLYPEEHVSRTEWRNFGSGYLLMPDPRAVSFTTAVYLGHRDGSVSHFDAYGRRPWQRDYGKEGEERQEFRTLHRFQGEFAYLFGPNRRGRSFEGVRLDPERDSDDFHAYHISLYRLGSEIRKRPAGSDEGGGA